MKKVNRFWILILPFYCTACNSGQYKPEKLKFVNTSKEVETNIHEFDILLSNLPKKHPYNVKSCFFINNRINVNGVYIGNLKFKTIDSSVFFVNFSKLEKQQVFIIMNYLLRNSISSALQIDNIWYHDYKKKEAKSWYDERRIILYQPEIDTSGLWKHSTVLGKDGNMLILAHTLTPQ